MTLGERRWRIRLALKDRPGALASLATTLSVHQVDILRIDVVSRNGIAVDDLWIDLPPDETVEALSVVLARLPGVSVLWLYAVAEADDPVSVMASACAEAAEVRTFAEICAKGIEGACRIADAEHSLLLKALGDGALGVTASTAPHLSGVASHEPCLAREAAAAGLPLGSQGRASWGHRLGAPPLPQHRLPRCRSSRSKVR